MVDEIGLGIKTQRAGQAQTLLDNELLKECFKTLHDDYMLAWKQTHITNVQGRETLFIAVQVVAKVQDHLKKMIIDGRIASKDLAALSHNLKPKR